MEEICLNCKHAKYADDDMTDLRCTEPKFNIRLQGTILSNSVCEDNGCDDFEKKFKGYELSCKGCRYLTSHGCNVCGICKRHELLKNLSIYLQNTAIDRYEV